MDKGEALVVSKFYRVHLIKVVTYFVYFIKDRDPHLMSLPTPAKCLHFECNFSGDLTPLRYRKIIKKRSSYLDESVPSPPEFHRHNSIIDLLDLCFMLLSQFYSACLQLLSPLYYLLFELLFFDKFLVVEFTT